VRKANFRTRFSTIFVIMVGFSVFNSFGSTLTGDYLIREVLQKILQKGDVKTIEDLLRKTNDEYPNFKLANYIEAEFYSAMAGQEIARSDKRLTHDSEVQHDLIEEAKLRLSLPQNVSQLKPLQILKIPDSTRYVILIDASISRAYVLKNKNGEPVLEDDFFITIGKLGVGKVKEGDQKTPLGLYTVGSEVEKKHLTPFYGIGALKLDFPNSFDKHLSKTGSGIWFHGVPKNIYNRPSRASDGCIVFTNSDFRYILNLSKDNRVNVLVTKSVDWLTVRDWRDKSNRLMNDLSEVLLSETSSPSKKQKKYLLGMYIPESQGHVILERGASSNPPKISREYWEKQGSMWNLKFQTRIKLGEPVDEGINVSRK